MNHSYNPKIHHRRSIRLRGYDYSQAGFYFITICTQNRLHLFGNIVGADSISAPSAHPYHSHPANANGAETFMPIGPKPNSYGVKTGRCRGGKGRCDGAGDGAEMDSAPTATYPMDAVSPPKMILNDAGKMVSKIWHEIPDDFHNARLHECVIMPNHIHGIIEIIPVGADSISAPIDAMPANLTKIYRAEMGDDRAEMGDDRAEMDSAPTAQSLPDMIQSFKRHTTIDYIKMVKQNILPPFNKRIWQRNYWEHIIRDENAYRKIAQYILDNPVKWALDKLNGGIGNQVLESQAPYNNEAWMV